MQPNTYTSYNDAAASSRYKILRNTYALLGLSLIPTIIGALIGTNINLAVFFAAGPIVSIVLMAAVFYGLVFAINRYRYSATGIYLLLAFTFFMGVWLGPLLQITLSLKNGGALVAMAGGATALLFLIMATIGATTKRDLTGLGNFLFAGAIMLMVAMVANLFLQIPILHLAVAAAFALFSTLAIMWHVKTIVDGGETSYIAAALSIYISIYNLFTSLLHLLSIFAGNRNN